MSKKKKPEIHIPSLNKRNASVFPELSFKTMAFIIGGLAFLLYFNSIFNEYTLDDPIVITKNAFTLKGFAGIPEIFKHDAFDNLQGTAGELTGGRYRPLSVATFAIEVALFGANHPLISHLINVLIYCAVCVMLLFFLYRFVFMEQQLLAFFTVFIFTIHPIHTEVIANIKSRDELLSLFFLLLSLILFFQYRYQKKSIPLFLLSLICFFLSFLSKENGITFIVVIPLLLYFFRKEKIQDCILVAFPFILVTALYFLIRFKVVGLNFSQSKEVMNSPFLFATATEKLATKTMILGKYLILLFFPHPLSYDYSYKQIPYVDITHFSFLASLLINGALVVYALLKIKEKSILSFAILFYFATLSVVSNFVFDVGSPMNERFVFQASIGFAMAIAYGIKSLSENEKLGSLVNRRNGVLILGSLLFLLSSFKTISRNADWKNDTTLFIKDAMNAPESAKTNGHCGVTYINLALAEKDSLKKREYFDKAIEKLNRAVALYPNYADPYINMGVAYGETGRLEEASNALARAKILFPSSNVLKVNMEFIASKYNELGEARFTEKKMEEAIQHTLKSVEMNPSFIKAWWNLGGYYLTLQNVDKARESWLKAKALDPGNKEINTWLERISSPPKATN